MLLLIQYLHETVNPGLGFMNICMFLRRSNKDVVFQFFGVVSDQKEDQGTIMVINFKIYELPNCSEGMFFIYLFGTIKF